MSLPRGDEIYTAIQNPKFAFVDADLKISNLEKNIFGLPKSYAGNFTTTYHFVKNSHEWAVRCFTKEYHDLQKRYEAIGEFLSKNPSNYFVDATLEQQGIHVGGGWYPIIKMDWVKGENINRYIENNLFSIDKLNACENR
jgi:aminoglycoside phosphotransferase (APT) family kinase protein